MLSDIVSAAIKRVAQWRPPTLDIEDVEQEAWVIALEVEQSGIIDPNEIQRAIERHFTGHGGLFETEAHRKEIPADPEDIEIFEQAEMLRGRGMSRSRIREKMKEMKDPNWKDLD